MRTRSSLRRGQKGLSQFPHKFVGLKAICNKHVRHKDSQFITIFTRSGGFGPHVVRGWPQPVGRNRGCLWGFSGCEVGAVLGRHRLAGFRAFRSSNIQQYHATNMRGKNTTRQCETARTGLGGVGRGVLWCCFHWLGDIRGCHFIGCEVRALLRCVRLGFLGRHRSVRSQCSHWVGGINNGACQSSSPHVLP